MKTLRVKQWFEADDYNQGHYEYMEYKVPCGQCPTCLKKRASDWTIKLINESKYHKECCFVTLTFSNEILLNRLSKAVDKYGAKASFPYNITYSKKYFCKFIKRLRAKFPDKKITYYHIGEYGENTHRAHHHVLFFGINFNEDLTPAEPSKSGKPMYFSQTLEDLWACGRTRIQLCNSNNIAYIAGYNTKKNQAANQTNYDYWKNLTPIQSFSNRSKMNAKFIRRHPEIMHMGFCTDEDGKKYAIPKSYANELKKEYIKNENPVFIAEYEMYSDRLSDFILNNDNLTHEKAQQIIKEKLRMQRQRHKFRDF